MFIVEKVDRLWEEFGGLSELPKEGKFKIPKENLFSDKCYSKIYWEIISANVKANVNQ